MRIAFRIGLIILIILIFIFLLTSYLIPHPTPLSPLAVSSPADSSPEVALDDSSGVASLTPIHYGFLPYWNLKYIDDIDYSNLTTLSYFALTTNASGDLIETDLGYRRFVSFYPQLRALTNQHQLQLDLVIKAESDPSLYSLLNNPSAQTNLLSNLSQILARYSLDGLNIDFEAKSATDSATISGFSKFIEQLEKRNSQLDLSVDIYPSAAASPKLWDLPALTPYIDHFIVMTYDYYQAGSDYSGPISPLYPARADDRHAIVKNVAQLTQQIPPEKLLLGLPLYGYEWLTEDPATGSPTVGSGELATFRRITQLLKDNPEIQKYWNPLTLTPWLSYEVNGQPHQIHYDNTNSLAIKTQFAQDAGLAGVAFWALGYASK